MNKIVVLDKPANDLVKKHKITVLKFNQLVFLKKLDFGVIMQALSPPSKKKLIMMLLTDLFNISSKEIIQLADNLPRETPIREFILDYANKVKRGETKMIERKEAVVIKEVAK